MSRPPRYYGIENVLIYNLEVCNCILEGEKRVPSRVFFLGNVEYGKGSDH
jgi:hypothetical protein